MQTKLKRGGSLCFLLNGRFGMSSMGTGSSFQEHCNKGLCMGFQVDVKTAVLRLGRIDFLQPLFEAVTNSLEANADTIDISIDVDDSQLLLRLPNSENKGQFYKISGFTVTDNGDGFTPENIQSFKTLYSDAKRDLGCIEGKKNALFAKFAEDIQRCSEKSKAKRIKREKSEKKISAEESNRRKEVMLNIAKFDARMARFDERKKITQ